MSATVIPARPQAVPTRREATADFAEQAGNIADQAGDAVGKLAGEIKAQAERIGTGVQTAADRAQASFRNAYGSSSRSDFASASLAPSAEEP